MRYILLMYWLSFKWIFKINLGDWVWYRGQKWIVLSGVRSNSWKLAGLNNNDAGWVLREHCTKVVSLKNFYGSFRSGLQFYRATWLAIWKDVKVKKI